jgi:hypothetical protein
VNDSDRTTTTVISPGIDLQVTADKVAVYAGQTVNYRYQVTNTGDTGLTQVAVVDDNGTPGILGDDVQVCAGISLAPGASAECKRHKSLFKTTTITARTTGRDTLGTAWTVSDQVLVIVGMPIYLPIITTGR